MKRFKIMCVTAILHIIFDIITVITINIENISPVVNLIMHLLFYYTAVFYCINWLSYILVWTFPVEYKNTYQKLCKLVFILYVVVAPFLNIEILQGNGTKYSGGLSVVVGYMLAYFFIITGMLLLIVKRKNIHHEIFASILPISILFMVSVTLQIFVPELLFTGASLTTASIGLFFAVENPANYFMKKAYTDANTNIKNRACFDDEFEKYGQIIERKGIDAPKIGIVIADLNGLKYSNDTFGHTTGDKMIAVSVEIMREKMLHACELYRVGGDEFVAIYQNKNCSYIENDIKLVERTCKEERASYTFPLSIAMGYAIHLDYESLHDTYERADMNMYENKIRMKKSDPSLIRI